MGEPITQIVDPTRHGDVKRAQWLRAIADDLGDFDWDAEVRKHISPGHAMFPGVLRQVTDIAAELETICRESAIFFERGSASLAPQDPALTEGAAL